jgi:hypothetical protein
MFVSTASASTIMYSGSPLEMCGVQKDVVECEQRAIGWNGLVTIDVESGAAELPAHERVI